MSVPIPRPCQASATAKASSARSPLGSGTKQAWATTWPSTPAVATRPTPRSMSPRAARGGGDAPAQEAKPARLGRQPVQERRHGFDVGGDGGAHVDRGAVAQDDVDGAVERACAVSSSTAPRRCRRGRRASSFSGAARVARRGQSVGRGVGAASVKSRSRSAGLPDERRAPAGPNVRIGPSCTADPPLTEETSCTARSSPDATGESAAAARCRSRTRSPRRPVRGCCWSACTITLRFRSPAATPASARRSSTSCEPSATSSPPRRSSAWRRTSRPRTRCAASPPRRTPTCSWSARATAGGLQRIVEGDQAMQVLHGAPCAVAVAPDPLAPRTELHRIGVGIDATPESALALVMARELAQHTGARLSLHAVVDEAIPGWVGLSVTPSYADALQELVEDRRAAAEELAGPPAGGVRGRDRRRRRRGGRPGRGADRGHRGASTCSSSARAAGVRCGAWRSAARRSASSATPRAPSSSRRAAPTPSTRIRCSAPWRWPRHERRPARSRQHSSTFGRIVVGVDRRQGGRDALALAALLQRRGAAASSSRSTSIRSTAR